jgi:hypothetical protein
MEDGQPAPRRVWNKLPETVAGAVLKLALKEPGLSPRELATVLLLVDERRGQRPAQTLAARSRFLLRCSSR